MVSGSQLFLGLPGQQRALPQDLPVIRPRLLTDPVDRRSRQDVMELVEQQLFPQPLHLPPGFQPRPGAPEVRLPQGKFAGAVPLFDRCLGGIRPPVALEIEFTHIAVFRPLGLNVRKEFPQ